MISEIRVKNTATFKGEQKIENLKMFNYFFGANGTGKTTISNIIANASNLNSSPFSECSIAWKNNLELETLVYNRGFIEDNFGEQNLKGVFTLGKENKKTQKQIDDKYEAISNIQDNVNSLKTTLNGSENNIGKRKELENLEEKYKLNFWKQKNKVNELEIKKGMQGFLGSAEKFKEKILSEASSNTSILLSLVELENKSKTVFDDALAEVSIITPPNISELPSLEIDPILKKVVVGKKDIDIAAMITVLGNSDWVRNGTIYFENNNSVCPFCQQKVDVSFEKKLEQYFDKTFDEDNDKIAKIIDSYEIEAGNIIDYLDFLVNEPTTAKFLDKEVLKAKKLLLDAIISKNIEILKKKKKEASQIVELDTTKSILGEIMDLISEANIKVNENNAIAKNIKKEKNDLINEIWKYNINELHSDIEAYKLEKSNLESAINNLTQRISAKETEKQQIEEEIKQLQKLTTSIQPTCDAINNLLSNFGYTSFKIAVTDDQKYYRLIRENGKDAKKTLSEGERNFVTFLYFYYLLRGSHLQTAVKNNKIVVIDDPVSSLDNDALFIVSTLVRGLIEQAKTNVDDIKQLFILSHNIYFYKEVTYENKSRRNSPNEKSFYLVKKTNNESLVENHSNNPIKTSYELLWRELVATNSNSATIQNVMRRILENYFKLLGGIDLDELINNFDGDDKLKCKALMSWVNDGSHSALDENYYTPLTDTEVLKFKEIFKQIFVKSGHLAHYEMMTKNL